KRVELAEWEGDKHLHGGKIAYEYADAALTLKGLIDEMESRYKLFKKAKVKDIAAYNAKHGDSLPWIVTVVDEFADLILQGKAAERKRCWHSRPQEIVLLSATMDEAEGRRSPGAPWT
ncbi:MAG TPA: FtsK/SpoIIIE domain-containing protein, partial [Pirellulales bacterium]|nr:FtsK/SpoIIIE domain-containing protein [Pirellulales bacterium]